MIWWVLIRTVLSCEMCAICTLGQELWVEYYKYRNSCDGTICSSDPKVCQNSCHTCLKNSTIEYNCTVAAPSPAMCSTSKSICGNSIYTVSPSNITTLNPFPSKNLCYWVLDMRQYIPYTSQNTLEITISYSTNLINSGELKVIGYLLPAPAENLSQYEGALIAVNSTGRRCFNYNYIEILYSSGSAHEAYTGLLITWDAHSTNRELSLENILSIVVASVILSICCTYCFKCLYKSKWFWGDQENVNSLNRSRIYQVLPNNSVFVVSENNFNIFLPILKYSKDLQEVGDSVCPICFDE
jgi:hypothetical protein